MTASPATHETNSGSSSRSRSREQRSAQTPPVMLRSVDGRVALGPLHEGMLPYIHRWFNDIETDRTQGDLPGPRTRERVQGWMERVMAADDMAMFAVYALDLQPPAADGTPQLQPVGVAWLSDINEHQRTCGFAISIGDASARGRGYGTVVTQLLLDYAFNALGLHHVSLEVYSNNPAGVRAYTRAGFRECGRFHEQYRHGQEVYDVILMECLQPWFHAAHPDTALRRAFSADVPRAVLSAQSPPGGA